MITFTYVLASILFFGSPFYLLVGVIKPPTMFFGNEYATPHDVKVTFAIMLTTSILLAGTARAIDNSYKWKLYSLTQEKQQILDNIEKQKQAQIAEANLRLEEANKFKKEQEAIAQETKRLKDTFGFTYDEFTETCSSLITSQSGSSDFGFWNQTGVSEIGGSLFLQLSVYGINAFGVKVEQRYKCWSNNQGGAEIEQIGVDFH